MPDNYSIDKRKAVRFLIAIPLKHAKISINDFSGTCTYDISAKGLGVITAEELPVNAPLILCLKIPDNGEEIKLEVEVAWSTRLDAAKYRSGLKLKSGQIKPVSLVLRTIHARL